MRASSSKLSYFLARAQGAVAPPSPAEEPISDSIGERKGAITEAEDFEALVGRIVNRRAEPSSSRKVSEEEMYASVVEALLKKEIGAPFSREYRLSYRQHFEDAKTSPKSRAETAANRSIRELVAAGAITEEEAASIKSRAASASQFDDNAELNDSISGPGDDTRSVKETGRAIKQAAAALSLSVKA